MMEWRGWNIKGGIECGEGRVEYSFVEGWGGSSKRG